MMSDHVERDPSHPSVAVINQPKLQLSTDAWASPTKISQAQPKSAEPIADP